jgi:hypothetical protein
MKGASTPEKNHFVSIRKDADVMIRAWHDAGYS